MDDALPFPMQARALTVRMGSVRALDQVDLDVEAGARLAVLGANGAGKSVLLRTLHGLVAPSGGSLRWGGSPVPPAAQAMVFQRPVMLRRTAVENVAYALRVKGASRHGALDAAHAALARVGLDHLGHRQARVLSGGEQQRVALARAWALQPRLLYLDEPTSSLDPTAAAEVERIIGQIHAAGTTIVFTTHNLGFARRLALHIAFLDHGRLTEVTPAERFFAQPASAEAAHFLRDELP